jgi:hypothetical protein
VTGLSSGRETVCDRTVKWEARVVTQAGKCGICSGKRGSETEVSCIT